MKDLQSPSFRSKENPDGSIALYYLSSHTGLYPFVLGALTVIAQRIFSLDINLSIINKAEQRVGMTDHQRTGECVTFRIEIVEREANASHALSTADSSALEACIAANFSNELKMNAADFCIALPYHIIMDEQCCLVQVGNALKDHISHELLALGTPVTKIFEIKWPQIPFDYKNICNSINAVFVLQAIESLEEKVRMQMKEKEITHGFVMKFRKNFSYHLQLKGQMMLLSDGDKLIYICSPHIISLYELAKTSMKIAEIPVHDTTRSLVLLREFLTDVDMHRQLEANDEQIESLEDELKAQDHKLGMALRKVLPETLAVNIMEGEPIEAREYEEATVMFADIPHFQEILSISHSKDVVHLLEKLFHRFDRLVGIHNVYKIDTVGDNFMTVAGIPDEFPEHAEMMCYTAIGMLWEARSVLEPVSKKPIQVRIAIHSGPLVAGVIASETPKYFFIVHFKDRY
ncbi:unnamed protein product [Cylicocyclus nassatus]|uniref:guanylate cyclase n=1 Tax=Cylicocyclus nassatus TaxID=53992 RepID=A0AA36GRD3_CYLNA|nr:unnamed protein product [Cylicocyclus nassatus]